MGLDVETTHSARINGLLDRALLEWAVFNGRVVLTYDNRTLKHLAQARVAAGESMPGVFVLPTGHTLKRMIDDLEVVIECLSSVDIRNQVIHFPLSRGSNL